MKELLYPIPSDLILISPSFRVFIEAIWVGLETAHRDYLFTNGWMALLLVHSLSFPTCRPGAFTADAG